MRPEPTKAPDEAHYETFDLGGKIYIKSEDFFVKKDGKQYKAEAQEDNRGRWYREAGSTNKKIWQLFLSIQKPSGYMAKPEWYHIDHVKQKNIKKRATQKSSNSLIKPKIASSQSSVTTGSISTTRSKRKIIVPTRFNDYVQKKKSSKSYKRHKHEEFNRSRNQQIQELFDSDDDDTKEFYGFPAFSVPAKSKKKDKKIGKCGKTSDDQDYPIIPTNQISNLKYELRLSRSEIGRKYNKKTGKISKTTIFHKNPIKSNSQILILFHEKKSTDTIKTSNSMSSSETVVIQSKARQESASHINIEEEIVDDTEENTEASSDVESDLSYEYERKWLTKLLDKETKLSLQQTSTLYF